MHLVEFPYLKIGGEEIEQEEHQEHQVHRPVKKK